MKKYPSRSNLAHAVSLINNRGTKVLGASFLAISASTVFAQSDASYSPSMSLEEIIVTARRKDESLQDVPQTVNAVNADTLSELNITNFKDMQNLVPGVSLDSGVNGYTTSAAMRGVGFAVESNTAPTVEFYLNDAPVESNQIFTQVFDVGQVEVLRGPQGTIRGRSAPSGAITVTTRSVNLDDVEGYVNATATDQGGTNYQGAVNVPVIDGKLGFRIAGVVDENEVNQVESVFNDTKPDSDISGFRATVGFAPTENFDGKLMYQKITKDVVSFTQFTGYNDGSTLPHHDFGSIQSEDRKGISATAAHIENEIEATTLNLNWVLGDHMLSYVGQYSEFQSYSNDPVDKTNYIYSSGDGSFSLGPDLVADQRDEWFQNLDLYQEQVSHEIRFSLDEPYKGLFDYTVGIFYQEIKGVNKLNGNQILSADLHPALSFLNPDPVTGAYILSPEIYRPDLTEEISAFASLTFYLGSATEITAGARKIYAREWNYTEVAGAVLDAPEQKEDDVIWNIAASHRFSDELMVYSNVGTSFRLAPMDSLGINPLPTPDANMSQLVGKRDPETSISYEVGVKLDFLDRRGRLNVAYYYQDFDNYLYYSKETQYFGTNGIEAFRFTSNADAVVQGIDLDASFQVTPSWSVSAIGSWNDSELKGPIPCNDGDQDGSPDFLNTSLDANHQVALCDTGASASSIPDWSATLRSEYFVPVGDSMEGYLSGIYSYYPENDNKHLRTTIDSYGLLNLYVGLRDSEGRWDVQLFAKNALDEEVVTAFEDLQFGSGGTLANYLGDSGYYQTQLNSPREIGLNVRYNFGL
ncbi:TonB-dependent receptor [Pseudomaricurvus hydrocarbonicus]|nr:TonB-dependent receptor [Aestuariicella hydrocarbonica]